ncbi:MAG: hypothetical protein ACLR07_17050 [Christensenellales bacterium]
MKNAEGWLPKAGGKTLTAFENGRHLIGKKRVSLYNRHRIEK